MIKRISLAAAVTLLAIVSLRADIIPTLSSISPSGGNFDWNYSVNLTVDQKVMTGDYFTIYDFGAAVPNSVEMPSGWTFSASLAGVTPGRVSPSDNPNVFNLTWTYTGQTTITGGTPLGIFTAGTTTDQLQTGNFAAQATRAVGPDIGTKIDNVGSVSIPIPEMSALAPILGICGLGLLGGVRALVRRNRLA